MTTNNENKRILVTAPLGVGGITSLMLNIQKNIERDRLNFDYLVIHDRDEAKEEEAFILGSRKYVASTDDIQNKLLRSICRYPVLFRLYKEKQVKVLHLNGGPASDLIGAIVAKLAGVKHITFHSHNGGVAVQRGRLPIVLSWLMRPFMPLFIDDFWACSSEAAAFSFPKSIVRNKKYTFVPNAINIKRFNYNIDDRTKLRLKLGLDGKFVVGHVGRFNVQKNHSFLIEIFKSVHERDKDAILLLFGDGELEDVIRNKVEILGLGNSVVFYGTTSEMNRMYQVLDVLVMPSLCEGLPVTGVEAQASGLPLILADTITREVAITKHVKYLSLDHDVNEWAAEIIKCKQSTDRCSMTDEVYKAGFDEGQVAEFFQRYYLDVFKRLS